MESKKRKITRPQLALEFNKRYGVYLKHRVEKLKEEVQEMEEALRVMTDFSVEMETEERLRLHDEFYNEVRDCASVMNQLEHLVLRHDWPQEVHDLLEKRDKDPDYGSTHRHVRNAEAGDQ